MSFLKGIFGKKEQQRSLTSVKDLKKDDIIVLTDSFALPETLRNQQFQITAVNSYEFESHTQTEWALTGTNDLELFLTLDIDDKIYLKFSLKVEHQDVESLFDLDAFAEIFEEAGQALLERQSDTTKTTGWSSEQYQQSSSAVVGFFHRKDHRFESLSAYEGKDSGEQFEQYTLFDADQDFGVEVEVWADGDTEVFLTLYRPVTDIIDMFPGS